MLSAFAQSKPSHFHENKKNPGERSHTTLINASPWETDSSMSSKNVNKQPNAKEHKALMGRTSNMHGEPMHVLSRFHHCFGNRRMRVHRAAQFFRGRFQLHGHAGFGD